MKKFLVAALFMLAFSSVSQAQTAIVVQTCGTLPQQYSVGASRQVVQDVNGNFCTNASGGGGGFSPTATPTALNAWSSATAANATQALMTNGGYPGVLVVLQQTSTITAGAATFEGTFDGTNWVTIPVAQVINPNTFAPLTNPYTLVASTNQSFLILSQGYSSLRVKLSTQITGSGTVTPVVTLWPTDALPGALLNPLVAGSAIIGKVGVDQTTMGTTNAVVSPGLIYKTVAASQTGQALGTGAAGDYLSHCVIYPATTGAGAVVAYDLTSTTATNVINFATGTLSNLAPIPVPVGAVSTGGPWKVTTGPNVSVTCYGKFTP